MRQVGIIAAAGIYALDNCVERLADDHRNAKKIGYGNLYDVWFTNYKNLYSRVVIIIIKKNAGEKGDYESSSLTLLVLREDNGAKRNRCIKS